MNILQIAPQIPYPLLDGGKVGIFNITRHLAQRGHQITLLAFDREEHYDPGPLPQFCEVIPVKHSTRNSLLGGFMNLFSGAPYNIAKYRSRMLEVMLKSLLTSRSFDVVHVDHLHMAHYGLMCKEMANLPIVLREHNIESTIVERFIETGSSLMLRVYLKEQVWRIRRYEAAMAAHYDACCVITEDDRKRLEELQPSVKARVVTGGVEAGYFAERPGNDVIPHSISFFGGLDWIPNQDAIHWFHDYIFPRIKEKYSDAKMYLIGKRPAHSIKALEGENVIIRGFVPDLLSEIRRYQVTVAPFRIGGGIRLKILESFAMRIPVVATTVGCEGILARHNEHLLIANTPEDFAGSVIRLFEDKALKERLTQHAFALAHERYRWEHVAEEFENVYIEAIQRKRRTGDKP